MMTKDKLEEALKYAKILRDGYENPTHTNTNEQLSIVRNDNNLIVAINGSNDFKDWKQNFSLRQKRFIHTPKTMKASIGYVNAAKNCLPMIMHEADVGDVITITGHSKGGGTAPIVALLLDNKGYLVDEVITFAAPKFSTQMIDHRLIKSMLKFVTPTDYVPKWPEDRFCRKFADQGIKHVIGNPVDEYIGVVRDSIKSHGISFYIKSLKEELRNV